MILKKLYWLSGFKSEPVYYFFVGFFYSIVGILLSWLIFFQNIGLAAVFFISLAAISQVDKKISLSEMLLGKTRSIGSKMVFLEEIITVQHQITLRSVFDDHKNLFKTYFFLFMGIMMCFSLITLVLPIEETAKIFGEQFKIVSPNAFSTNTFSEILSNNLAVLLTGFFLALIFEFGTTFIIVWNASVWGTAFALAARHQFLIDLGHPFINFAALIIVVLTYLPFEAAAYFSSSIAGGLLHKAATRESIFSVRFKVIATHVAILIGFGTILLGLSAIIETYIIHLFW